MSAKGHILLHEESDMRCPETAAPFYSLQYRSSTREDLAAERSYQIISALKKENDLIIELNSSLFVIPAVRREKQALDYQEAYEALGLEHRMRSSIAPSQSNLGLLGMLGLGQKNQTQYEMLFHIPESIWNDHRFKTLIPIHGARYYMLREGVSGSEILEKIFSGRLSGKLKQDMLALNIFDCSLLGQMGIYSYAFEKNDLEDRISGLL